MLIPWNTDAPLYHFPFVTIGLIVANTLAFGAELASEDPEPWMLAFGDGLHPVQWVTSFFMHADPMHLIGNMLFLWGFGLVIEGKVGWWRFLLIYLGLGVFQAALVQMCMFNGEGGALGASGAIYGLLAMALIWAPRNELNCVGIFGVRIMHLDLPILGFVTFYVVWELVMAWLDDFQMSSAMLHLAGALPGFVLAIAMLKLGLVDCEQWDVFAVLAGREGQAVEPKPDPRKIAARQAQQATKLATAQSLFREHLQQGRAAEALAVHQRVSQSHSDWQLSQAERLELIKCLHKDEQWSASVGPMAEYLRATTDVAPRVRLKLAQILIMHDNRPGRALSVLEKIPAGSLTVELERMRQKLEAQARKMYEQGEIELESEDW